MCVSLERLRSRAVKLYSLHRYGLIHLTRALLTNGEISADRLSTYYPWCVRYFQAKHIRYRRAVKQPITKSADMPLMRELMKLWQNTFSSLIQHEQSEIDSLTGIAICVGHISQ